MSYQNIPTDHLEEIKSHSEWVKNLPMGLPQKDDRTRYFFDIYGEYIGKPQDITCHACRGKVLMHIRNIISWLESDL